MVYCVLFHFSVIVLNILIPACREQSYKLRDLRNPTRFTKRLYVHCYYCTADIDMSVVGAHVAHTTATLAMGGEYSQARLSALSSQRMLQRNRYLTTTF